MNETALITGASSGIGEALMHEFASRGYRIIAVAQDQGKLLAAVEKHQAMHGVEIIPIAKDLRQEKAAQEIFDELQQRGIEVNVLVNDAGVGWRSPFVEEPLEKAISTIRLNIEALTRLTHLFLPPMIARGRGHILNLGSIAGFQPGPLLAVYSASKAYVVSFSEALADELKDTGVKVTCLCPGATDTAFFEKANMENSQVVAHKDTLMMSPEEVAKAGFEGMAAGDLIVVPGAINKIITFSRRLSPAFLQAKAQRMFYEKSE